MEWMHYNGKSIPFMQSRQSKGKATALDNLPKLDEDGEDIWQMYCYIGEDILMSMDVYEKRIGIPLDWAFEECIIIVSQLQAKKRELIKANKSDG